MYPDPITPRANPELLARVDYDPFDVMPLAIPKAPRVFASQATLDRAKQRLADGSKHDHACFQKLKELCKLDQPLPELKPPSGPLDWGGGSLNPWLTAAFHNALSGALSGDARHYERAKNALLLAAQACPEVGKSFTGNEHHEAVNASRAYDLLVAHGLSEADDKAIRGLLESLVCAMDRLENRACNNHNTMQMWGRLSLASALGNKQHIHDTLYGCSRSGIWRYGLVHVMRHDFLNDGMQWEGAVGYHALVVMMVCECFTMLENLGRDLWKKEWPSLRQNDGFDEHRGWGAKCLKPVSAAFEALLYQSFSNGDYSLLHDQILGNLRGTVAWWPIFHKAYKIFRDPRYAWALRHINGSKPISPDGPLPVWLENANGPVEFARLDPLDIPQGEHPFAKDRAFAAFGRHVSGCSIFPTTGSAVLRSKPTNPKAPGASLYWGPHWAGHRAPAALHLDIHAFGRRLATAPHHFGVGYTSELWRSWNRATIAHNTVCVNKASMFPYDFPSKSLWECDIWRDTISDGELVEFQPGARFHAARARNDNVYKGVLLDRTVVLATRILIDVFRVSAEQPALLDYALHVAADFGASASGEALNLGEEYGYRHLSDARLHAQTSGWVNLPFCVNKTQAGLMVWLGGASGARLIRADDPAPDTNKPIGDLNPAQPSVCFITRANTASALFVSAWVFDDSAMEGGLVTGAADTDVTVSLRLAGKPMGWSFPIAGPVRRFSTKMLR